MTYDLVLIGSSFASTFFLLEYLRHVDDNARVLVLERGALHTHPWQIANKRHSSLQMRRVFSNKSETKTWITHIAFGGNSNCWWACTPRMMPNDFRTRSEYGVGTDWPVSYDELEESYDRAETIMNVSGPADGAPFPRSRPYPQPPHRFTDPDKRLKAAYPDTYFQQPTARARRATEKRRACCATGVCHLCPVDAKFTVLNELRHVYDDPRVTLLLEADVASLESTGNVVTAVSYRKDGKTERADASLVALGANALFNPAILTRSGISHPMLGKGLNEQISVTADVYLDGVDNFQGSTSITGHGYMLYDGEHRRDYAGCLIESWNVPRLRPEEGRWRQVLELKFIFEDLPSVENHVSVPEGSPDVPEAHYTGFSSYTQRGIDNLTQVLPKLLAPLPVERWSIREGTSRTEGHIQGTTPMGRDPQTSIVDSNLVHHSLRNLVVLGSGVFPSCPPANPTLTLAALSLRAAGRL